MLRGGARVRVSSSQLSALATIFAYNYCCVRLRSHADAEDRLLALAETLGFLSAGLLTLCAAFPGACDAVGLEYANYRLLEGVRSVGGLIDGVTYYSKCCWLSTCAPSLCPRLEPSAGAGAS